MNLNQRSSQTIGRKEIVYSVSNMMIGLGILTLPHTIAKKTQFSDGWMPIILGGMIAFVFAWAIGVLASRFPGKNYHAMASMILSRKAAHVLTLLMSLYFLLFVSYQVRGVSTITRLYLFDNTPEEIIGLVYLLVLIYAVAGPSIALVRLNLIFFPIVVTILLLIVLLNLGSLNMHFLLPVFKTDWRRIVASSKDTVFSYLGLEIMLFYNIYVARKSKLPGSLLRGLLIPICIYFVVFVFVIGVFGPMVVSNTLYPLAELAKEVEVPGGIFERFEFFFFVIWLMTLFSTNAMAFDVALLALESVFPKHRRFMMILVLGPVLFILGLLPSSLRELNVFAEWISYMGVGFAWVLPALLLLIAKVRGVKGDG
ncbi:endospore germination permease [Paenibacillus sp. JNUCC32]|uniref:GerAB/ArcD/ProY family transporter n=1 Tax=Paenibacillus sp. JNUCC32 TaxID=2777984 RepID=UPI00178896E4|nr:endospore germination permease [Paenibacillus sp. JNUCC-32]QOT07949.1 endospore germination permease [Paenibacillus sp. JNUCC-32]